MALYSLLRKGDKLVQKHIAKKVSPKQLFAALGQRRELPSFTGRLVSQEMNSWQVLFPLFDETFWVMQSGNLSQRKASGFPGEERKIGKAKCVSTNTG